MGDNYGPFTEGDIQTFEDPALQTLDAVTNLELFIQDEQVRAQWDEVDGANVYRVQTKPAGGEWSEPIDIAGYDANAAYQWGVNVGTATAPYNTLLTVRVQGRHVV